MRCNFHIQTLGVFTVWFVEGPFYFVSLLPSGLFLQIRSGPDFLFLIKTFNQIFILVQLKSVFALAFCTEMSLVVVFTKGLGWTAKGAEHGMFFVPSILKPSVRWVSVYFWLFVPKEKSPKTVFPENKPEQSNKLTDCQNQQNSFVVRREDGQIEFYQDIDKEVFRKACSTSFAWNSTSWVQ